MSDEKLESDKPLGTWNERAVKHTLTNLGLPVPQVPPETLADDPKASLGLYSELDPGVRVGALAKAKERLESANAYNALINLARDPITVPGQNFAVVCWVGPTFRAKTDIYGFRIMGAFDSLLNARKYALKAHKADPTYDIGVMQMNLWCLGFPMETDIVRDADGNVDENKMEENRDRALNEFIIRHKTNLYESEELFEARRLLVRESKITKEVDEKHALISEVPKGKPNEEMKQLHELHALNLKTPEEIQEIVAKQAAEKAQLEKEEAEIENDLPELDHECKQRVPNQEYAAVSFVGHTGKNSESSDLYQRCIF